MGKVTFVDRDQYTTVYVDGKMSGRIMFFAKPNFKTQYAYVPKGHQRGDLFDTLAACK